MPRSLRPTLGYLPPSLGSEVYACAGNGPFVATQTTRAFHAPSTSEVESEPEAPSPASGSESSTAELASFEAAMGSMVFAAGSFAALSAAAEENHVAGMMLYSTRGAYTRGIEVIRRQCAAAGEALVAMESTANGPLSDGLVSGWHDRVAGIQRAAVARLASESHAALARLDVMVANGTLPPNKKKRTNFDAQARKVLREWRAAHGDRPDESARNELARASGLSAKQVATWFANARYRASGHG